MIWLGAALAGDLETMAELPDPGAAVGICATVGFGAGHIYAGSPATGLLLGVVQAAGVGMLAGSKQAESPESVAALTAGGAVLFFGARMIECGTAPLVARATWRRELEKEPTSADTRTEYERLAAEKQAELERLQAEQGEGQ